MSFFKLKDHQEKAVEEMHNGCILVGDVGTGKSATVAEYYKRREAPRDIYVITTAKKRDSFDWVEEFVRVGVGTDRDATLHGVLVVDSWNNIGKYRDVKDAFFVFDEQRLVGSGSWTKSFYKIAKTNRWVLLSATPGDTWMDYIPVFVANGFYKNKTEFVREHVVWSRFAKYPKVERYLSTGRLVRYRNQLLVDMPLERHTTRHLKWVNCDYDIDLLERVTKKRWNVYENAPLRDVAELFRVARKVANSDISRLGAIRLLMERHPRLIVFYNFDYELEQLRTLVESNSEELTGKAKLQSSEGFPDPETSYQNNLLLEELQQQKKISRNSSDSRSKSGSGNGSSMLLTADESSQRKHELEVKSSDKSGRTITQGPSVGSTNARTSSHTQSFSSGRSKDVVIAEWNGHKHEPVPTSERWVYLVQYQAGSEGWNCITTDAMVFWSLTYSYKNWHQAFGRIDRLNTPYSDLWYYALVSKSWIDLAVQKSLRAKKSFNEASARAKMTW